MLQTQININRVRILSFCFCAFILMSSLFAGDGQIDIRPTGTATFTISNPGSYILTDNVTMTADAHCINIMTSNVTLDLNGHTITGNGSNYSGIYGSGACGITIFNGTVSDFGGNGIKLSVNCRLVDITVNSNGGHGVELDDACQLTHVTAVNNDGFGIKTLTGCVIDSCVASYNTGGIGIEAGLNCTVKNCTANNNGVTSGDASLDVAGISADNGSVIIGCSSWKNQNKSTGAGSVCGIKAGQGCTVINNSCHENKAENAGKFCIGIDASHGSTLIGNTCYNNDSTGENSISIGIDCGLRSVVKDNACSDNTATGDTGAQAYGIRTTTGDCLIVGNNCIENDGNAYSYGIAVGGDHNRIENNLCTGNNAGSGAGIFLSNQADDCVVIRNTTSTNDAGINLGGKDAYCAENMSTDGIINSASATMGTGDRSNIAY